MILKRYKDFINEDYDDDFDEEYDDEYADDWDGIARHEGNEEMYRVDNRMNYDLYDAHGNVELKMVDTDNKGKIVYQFVDRFDHEIKAENLKLTSLEGFPSEVAADIRVDENNLKNLIGAPKQVDSIFSCDSNLLTSLEGAPERVEEFYCRRNEHLTDLKGGPKYIENMFDASFCVNLTSLEGAPEEAQHLDFSGCTNLVSLKGITRNIGASLDIEKTGVYSMYDLVGVEMGDGVHFTGSKLTQIEVDYFFTEAQWGTQEEYYPKFFNFLIRTFDEYPIEDLSKIVVPENELNKLDDPKLKNILKSAKAISKYSL